MHTNLVYFAPPPGRRSGEQLAHLVGDLREQGVWLTRSGERLRAVTHLDVDDAGIERALTALTRWLRRPDSVT